MARVVALCLAIGGLVATLSGCSTLPDSGPAHRSIESGAGVSITGTTPVFDYALVDLNKSVLPFIVDPGPGSLYRTFGTGRGPVPEILVGVGDTVSVTLFEAQAGGLFIPNDAGSRPGNFVTLPNQTVDSKGYISVPYAGQIKALGRSTPAIQQDIVDRLKDRAIEPQAIVALTAQTSTEVTVVGEVNAPNKFAVNPSGDKILDVIARAGGIKDQGYENYVTLQRRGLKGTVYFLNLVRDPKENIYVSPGDAVYVSFYQRSFMAFGATGASGQFKFQQEILELNEAVGKAGGLLDNRSDPGQVFVYRLENRDALARMGADVSHFSEDRLVIPTIYRVNFRDPSGFFASRKFPMRDGDILYVDNADEVELTKFLSLITTVTGSTATVATDLSTTRDAIRDLGH
ncbi:MAG: polysaccharide biosynthesis/export family protein [Roseiarcus sp.]|jgi:polysaccharide export outer membrane protein